MTTAASSAEELKGWTGVTTSALLLGLVHASVDCASGFLIFRDVASAGLARNDVVALVVLYNLLAFAGQAPVGLVADRLRSYRAVALLGVALAAAALALAPSALIVGVVLVGVGNACFHVGAGAHVLRSSGSRATEAGVFVGPGAAGLAAGLMLGGGQAPARWFIVAVLLIWAPLVRWLVRTPTEVDQRTPLPRVRSGALVVALAAAVMLFGSVTVRAIVGDAVAGTWRGVSVEVMVLLAGAACLGKMLGGFLGDRLGWGTLSLLALLLSAPLVSVLVTEPEMAVLGMLIFQMTMAVTLKAMHHLMPTRPGLAFGVPCVALIAGALPGLLGLRLLGSWPLTLTTVLLSTLLVTVGLALLARSGASLGPRRELLVELTARAAPLRSDR